MPGFLHRPRRDRGADGRLDAQVPPTSCSGSPKSTAKRFGGGDKVREVLLQIGGGPNLIQLLEPTAARFAGARSSSNATAAAAGSRTSRSAWRTSRRAFDDMTAKGFKIINKAPRKARAGRRCSSCTRSRARTRRSGSSSRSSQERRVRCSAGLQARERQDTYVRRTESADAPFPPVSTAEWDAQIVKDLKGADYEKRLVWKTDEGIAVRPYYRAEHAAPREPIANVAGAWEMVLPGAEPALSIDAVVHHENGATAVQEVAWALAEGADHLAAGRLRHRGRRRHRFEPLHGDRQAASAAPAVGGRRGGVRPAGDDSHPRAHGW